MYPVERSQHRGLAVLVAMVFAVVVVAGCGGDDDGEESVETIPEVAEIRAYCDSWSTVEEAIADPTILGQLTADQLDQLAALAPEDVADDVGVVVDGVRQAQDGDAGALDSSSFGEAFERLVEYQTEVETEDDAPCEQGVGELDG